MGPLLYMWSVLDRNVIKWRMTVVCQHNYSMETLWKWSGV